MPQAPQYLVLTVSFFVIETVWQLIYTVSGRLVAWLQQVAVCKPESVCGAIFTDCGEPGTACTCLIGIRICTHKRPVNIYRPLVYCRFTLSQ